MNKPPSSIHAQVRDLGLFELAGSRASNIVLHETPACHTFAPVLDTRPGVPADERFKALAGLHDEAIAVTRKTDLFALRFPGIPAGKQTEET